MEQPAAAAPGSYPTAQQDESQATYECWFQAAESKINWANHVDVGYDLIRACNPAPGAWTNLGDTKLFVYDCRKHRIGRYGDSKGKPGEITHIGETSIFVTSQSGQIEVLKLRAEDGKKMGAADYARAQSLVVGSKLG